MSVIKAYSSNSAKVGIDGVPLAGVELAEEYERHSEYPVLGFGDCVPSAILTFDRSYEIVLERTASIGDGVRLENAEPFELQIGARLYGGCRCTAYVARWPAMPPVCGRWCVLASRACPIRRSCWRCCR